MAEAETKPTKNWYHIPIQVFFGSLCVYWYWHVPAPNKAALCLAGVAAIMALAEMRPLHKGIYFALIVCLLFVENRAIDKDRRDFAEAEACRRAEENAEFSGIGDTITQNVQKLLDHSDAQFRTTMGGIGDTMKMQTGGDSFAYITFTPEPNQQFLVSVTSRGKYPLRGTTATIVDDEREVKAMLNPGNDWIATLRAQETHYQIPYLRPQSPEAPTGDVQPLGADAFGTKDSNDLTIAFGSSNGYWNERLHLRRINGKWHQSLSVVGPTANQVQHPFFYSDPDYPEGKALAEKDWPLSKQHRH